MALNSSNVRSRRPKRALTEAKRNSIVVAATTLFAQRGYHRARMDDVAAALGISKGSVFQHFGSKEQLFLEVYRTVLRTFHKYLDVPVEVQELGFFEILRYWLVRSEHLVHEHWIPYRIMLLGNYATELTLKRDINRFHLAEDPFGAVEFVHYGLKRDQLRGDLEIGMIASFLGWMMDRFQDALLIEELDPGLFRHANASPEKKEARIEQFIGLIQRAIGV
jgi:AcrR family transcriptional regulator